jgi:hypothetical protein
MSTIRACGLAMDDAEDVLAKVWRVLEMRAMDTPRLRVDPASNGTIDLRIAFKHTRDADLMLRSLPNKTRECLMRDFRLFTGKRQKRAPRQHPFGPPVVLRQSDSEAHRPSRRVVR